MGISFKNVDRENLYNARERYRKNLPDLQELFLEMKVRESDSYLIKSDDQEAGYCFLGKENDLAEFYLEPEFLPTAESVFDSLLKQHEVKTIWCLTFDRLLLSLCLERHLAYEVVGYSFRQRAKIPTIALPADIEVRPATDADIDIIWEKNDCFFESREEIVTTLKNEIVLYFHAGEDFIGSGTIMHISQGSNARDVGMMVSPVHRKKGIGAAMVNYMANYCMQNNWRPNFGCAADNIASRKTLEKAGFVTRDRLLQFKV